mgnify:CR=1 FL=1
MTEKSKADEKLKPDDAGIDTSETTDDEPAAEDEAGKSGAEKESRGKGKKNSDPDSKSEKNDDAEDISEEKKKDEDEDLNTKYLRLMADFQNYKKRCEKERGEIHAYANRQIIAQLLEVVDSFERALQQDAEGHEKFREGMVLIFDQLKNVLEKTGVEEIKAKGEPFDPKIHNAVMAEKTDEVKSGHVSEVMQKGYTLNGKVIRPSMVKVAE